MCDHLESVLKPGRRPVTPGSDGCRECLETGGGWVHLRLCMTCGHVGCCDSSVNRHATRHFHESGHPVIKSFEPREAWAWCYRDEEALPTFEAYPVESPRRHLAAPGASP